MAGLDSLAHPASGALETQLSFVKHSDLAHLVTVKVASFQGLLPQRGLPDLLDHPELRHHGFQQALPSDLYVHLELWADNKRLVPPVQTAHKAFKSRTQVDWNEHITLPIKYRDLPLGAQLAVTVYDIAGPRQRAVVGGATLRLFGNKCTLKKGKQRLYLWKGVRADGSAESETPSKVGLKDEMGRLEKLVKKHERGDIARLDWLDKLAFRQIEKIHKVRFFARGPLFRVDALTLVSAQAESEKSDNLFLYIDLPRFDFPVVFSEPVSCLVALLAAKTAFDPGSRACRNTLSPSSHLTPFLRASPHQQRPPLRRKASRLCRPRPRSPRPKPRSLQSSTRRSCAKTPSRRSIVDWCETTATDRSTGSSSRMPKSATSSMCGTILGTPASPCLSERRTLC